MTSAAPWITREPADGSVETVRRGVERRGGRKKKRSSTQNMCCKTIDKLDESKPLIWNQACRIARAQLHSEKCNRSGSTLAHLFFFFFGKMFDYSNHRLIWCTLSAGVLFIPRACSRYRRPSFSSPLLRDQQRFLLRARWTNTTAPLPRGALFKQQVLLSFR